MIAALPGRPVSFRPLNKRRIIDGRVLRVAGMLATIVTPNGFYTVPLTRLVEPKREG